MIFNIAGRLKKTVILGFMLAAFSSCDLFAENKTFTPFQQAVLAEINLARTNPAGYAQNRLSAEQNAGTDNGAYEELTAAAPVTALVLETRLCQAASSYAEYLAVHNVFSHTADADLSTRIRRTGYKYSACGENIAAGSSSVYLASADPAKSAREFVKMLVIDSGVSGVGHRCNIRSTSFTQLGAGYGYNESSDYENYNVQNFGKPQ